MFTFCIREMMGAIERSVNAVKVWSLPLRVNYRLKNIDLLLTSLWLQGISRKNFGWITSHKTRWWEYPWVVKQVRKRLRGRSPRVLDSGAGKSPVPIALKKIGLECAVADPDIQTIQGRRSSNEWSWTDYGQWGIRSYRAGMEEAIFENSRFGFVVCISVIEHVPARIRRKGLKEFARILQEDGMLILTVDLVGKTRLLWNRVLGQEVDKKLMHGSLDDLIKEAVEVGFKLVLEEKCPVGTPDQDVIGLVFVKCSQ